MKKRESTCILMVIIKETSHISRKKMTCNILIGKTRHPFLDKNIIVFIPNIIYKINEKMYKKYKYKI